MSGFWRAKCFGKRITLVLSLNDFNKGLEQRTE